MKNSKYFKIFFLFKTVLIISYQRWGSDYLSPLMPNLEEVIRFGPARLILGHNNFGSFWQRGTMSKLIFLMIFLNHFIKTTEIIEIKSMYHWNYETNAYLVNIIVIHLVSIAIFLNKEKIILKGNISAVTIIYWLEKALIILS